MPASPEASAHVSPTYFGLDLPEGEGCPRRHARSAQLHEYEGRHNNEVWVCSQEPGLSRSSSVSTSPEAEVLTPPAQEPLSPQNSRILDKDNLATLDQHLHLAPSLTGSRDPASLATSAPPTPAVDEILQNKNKQHLYQPSPLQTSGTEEH